MQQRYWASVTTNRDMPETMPFWAWSAGIEPDVTSRAARNVFAVLLNAPTPADAREQIKGTWPDAAIDFIAPKPPDWLPDAARFPA